MKAFIELLNKKKTQAALVTLVLALAAKLGLNLGIEVVGTIVTLGVLLIGGLAWEDKGKAATKIETEAAIKAAEIDRDIAEAQAREAEALAETARVRTETEA